MIPDIPDSLWYAIVIVIGIIYLIVRYALRNTR
jgi:hypothetical protein